MTETREMTRGALIGKVAGSAKEFAGELTGNDELARAGRIQQARSEGRLPEDRFVGRGRRRDARERRRRGGGRAGRRARPRRAPEGGMTALQTIPKAAVEGAIKIARLPADALVGVAPETRITSAIGTAVDRADARVRSAAGNALRDTELQREAGLLRSAVDERRRTREPRTESRERARRASAQDIEARELAEKQRRTADLNAAKKRAAARRRREQRAGRGAEGRGHRGRAGRSEGERHRGRAGQSEGGGHRGRAGQSEGGGPRSRAAQGGCRARPGGAQDRGREARARARLLGRFAVARRPLELGDQLVEVQLLELARDGVELGLAELDQVLRLDAELERLAQLGFARVEPGDDRLEPRDRDSRSSRVCYSPRSACPPRVGTASSANRMTIRSRSRAAAAWRSDRRRRRRPARSRDRACAPGRGRSQRAGDRVDPSGCRGEPRVRSRRFARSRASAGRGRRRRPPRRRRLSAHDQGVTRREPRRSPAPRVADARTSRSIWCSRRRSSRSERVGAAEQLGQPRGPAG